MARASGKLIFIHQNKVFACYFSLNLAETKTQKVIIASLCIVVLIFSASVSQSSCLIIKADSRFVWKTTTHNRFVLLFTSEFYRVLKRNSSELIAMKRELNYTVEVNFFHSQNQRAKAGSMALEVEIFMPCI